VGAAEEVTGAGAARMTVPGLVDTLLVPKLVPHLVIAKKKAMLVVIITTMAPVLIIATMVVENLHLPIHLLTRTIPPPSRFSGHSFSCALELRSLSILFEDVLNKNYKKK
jgi:hypothetical protein